MSAVDGVARDVNGPKEKAVSIHIPRKYPPAPEGVHRAICISAEVKEVQQDGKYAMKGDKRIHFGWELCDPTYKDDEGNDRKYRVWSKPMSPAFFKAKNGKEPNVYKLLTKLTGYGPFTTKETVMVDLGNGSKKPYDADVFDQEMVKMMECSLVIAHEEYMGEQRATIESYTTTEEQRKKNFMLLPPEARSAYKGEAPAVQEVPQEEAEGIKPIGAPVPGEPQPTTAVEQAIQTLNGMVKPEEYAAFEAIVLSDFNAEELARLPIAETKKRLGLA